MVSCLFAHYSTCLFIVGSSNLLMKEECKWSPVNSERFTRNLTGAWQHKSIFGQLVTLFISQKTKGLSDWAGTCQVSQEHDQQCCMYIRTCLFWKMNLYWWRHFIVWHPRSLEWIPIYRSYHLCTIVSLRSCTAYCLWYSHFSMLLWYSSRTFYGFTWHGAAQRTYWERESIWRLAWTTWQSTGFSWQDGISCWSQQRLFQVYWYIREPWRTLDWIWGKTLGLRTWSSEWC